MSAARPKLGAVFRVLVATALTAFIFWKSRPAEVLQACRAADPWWILGAVGLVLVDRALNAYRWLVLLRPVSSAAHVTFWPVMRIFFVSTFVGTFLPGVGGDAVRAFSLARLEVPAAASVVSVLMDRVLGLLSVLIVAAAGLWLAGGDLARHPAVVTSLLVTAGACAATAAIVFSGRAAGLALRLLSWAPWPRVRRVGTSMLGAAQSYATARGELLQVLLGSLGVQGLRIVQAWCLGMALGIAAPLSVYLALIPLILLVMLVPVTVSGLGTGQLAFVGLFGRFGVSSPQGFALSVLFVGLGVVGNLPGAILYLGGGLGGARRAKETP